jgi:sarcosine oxidase subunit beta
MEATETADIVIIGGGVIGASTAYQLTQRGAGKVLLLEQTALASGGTGWSSAIVRTHYTIPMLARMARRGRDMLADFAQIVGGPSGFTRTGFLVLLGPADVEAARRNVEMLRSIGIATSVLTPEEAQLIEPRLNYDGVAACVWEPDSGYGDAHSTTFSFAEAARRGGAELRVGVRVQRLLTDAQGVCGVETAAGVIATRRVLVAAGYRTAELVAPLGVSVPLTPIRHSIAVVRRPEAFGARHPIISDRVRGSYYRPEGGELTLIGTTAADEGEIDSAVENSRRPHLHDEMTLLERYITRFPKLETAAVQPGYTGVYDCSPDLQPLLGPTEIAGLHIAVGFSGHGYKLSPVVGELLAGGLLNDPAVAADLEFFSPQRFGSGRTIRSDHPYSVGTLG